MTSRIKKALEWMSFFMGATGMGFLLTSVFMTIFHIGRNPLTALAIGIILIGLAVIVMEVVTEKCPRCGSRLVENGKCLICDYTREETLDSQKPSNGQKGGNRYSQD